MSTLKKKFVLVTLLFCALVSGVIIAQAQQANPSATAQAPGQTPAQSAQAPAKAAKSPSTEKPKNLKVFPKGTSMEMVSDVMHNWTKSLGVHCTYCHVATGEGKEMKFDWASDAKPEKTIARQMVKMSMDINKKYIAKMGDHKFESISCTTCHMGHAKPLVSVDSLPKKG